MKKIIDYNGILFDLNWLNFDLNLLSVYIYWPTTVLAVSSSPRPWIDVFDSMAVTESELDPKVRKMSITFYWPCHLWAEHVGMELKCYWF